MKRLTRLSATAGFVLVAAGTMILLLNSGSSIAQDKGDPGPQEALGIDADYGKWAGGVVQVVYNPLLPDPAPAGFTDDAAALASIQASLDEWEGVCDVEFQLVGSGIDNGAVITDDTDGIVVIAWDDSIGGAAGQAGPSWSLGQDRTGPGHFEYEDGSVRLNPTVFDESLKDADQIANNRLAFDQTVAHEIGHLLGFGHADHPTSIMWANPYNSLNHLRDNDIEGCRSVYGYSDLETDPAEEYAFVPQAPGANGYDFIFLSSSSDPATQITVDDGTEADTAQLFVRWQYTANDGYDELVVQEIVDPHGIKSLQASAQIMTGFLGAFGIASFERLRELPGIWTVHVADSNGEIIALPFDVQVAGPTPLEPPGATLAVTENPATRATTLSVDVQTVSAAAMTPNQVTVNWHIGTQGFFTETVAVPGNANRNVTFGDALPHEVHVEIFDDQPRYAANPPDIGPAGTGFQTLLPYFSSPLNLGPDGGGDNSADITLFNDSTGEVFQWNMHGNLIEPRGAIADLVDTNWDIVGHGDYNGDGKSDLLWQHPVDGRIYLWLMDGRTILSSTLVLQLSDLFWQVVANGDFNGDGQTDILWRHSISGLMYYWQMNGPVITTATPIRSNASASGLWNIVADGDFTGDGRADLMWMNPGTGQVYLWEMNAGMIVSASQVAIVGDNQWGVVGDGDLNGDGMADLVWQRRGGGADGKVYYWEMDGATINSSARISIVADQDWEVRGTGDYNGDSLADILWYNTTTGEVYHWQQNGATTLRSGQIAVGIDTDWDIVDLH